VVERSLPQREGLAAFVELRELIRILFSETEECVFGLPSGSFTARLVLIVLICISAVAGCHKGIRNVRSREHGLVREAIHDSR
jgi:hypothetical protein